MFCRKCGSSINDDSDFCSNCGAPVTKTVEQTPLYSTQPVTVQQPITLTQAQPLRENGFAIAGLILSMVSFVVAVSQLKYASIIVPLSALALSIIGVCRKNSKRKGMAIAGIIISANVLIIAISMLNA